MRSKLLPGAALATLLLAAPSISVVSSEDNSRRDRSVLDPLALNREICRARGADGRLDRRGLFIAAARAYAQTTAGGNTSGAPPLFEGVASDALEATANDAALPYFRQGVGLVDGFNHMEGVRAFRAAQALDPDCALCF